jgi:hypothetical protein
MKPAQDILGKLDVTTMTDTLKGQQRKLGELWGTVKTALEDKMAEYKDQAVILAELGRLKDMITPYMAK